jgi:hypothetical protein
MKGQTQAVTAVMITGVIVGGIASAYVWGIPLIDKRQGQSELRSLESSVIGLEESIVSVSQSGQGSADEVTLELDNGRVEVNETGNYVDITTFSESSPYAVGTWRLLRGQSLQGLSFGAGEYGIQGENTPGIVAVKSESASTSAITYRVEFRNLRTTTPTGPELRQVDIQAQGASRERGDVTFEMTNEGRRMDSGSTAVDLSGGGSIDRRRTVVSINLR